MSQIEAETLLPSPRMRKQAATGTVTQVHRGQQYAEEGDTFEIEGQAFRLTEVSRRTLGDLTDADARAEGAENLDQYREILRRAHEGFEWNDDSEVVCHRFERL